MLVVKRGIHIYGHIWGKQVCPLQVRYCRLYRFGQFHRHLAGDLARSCTAPRGECGIPPLCGNWSACWRVCSPGPVHPPWGNKVKQVSSTWCCDQRFYFIFSPLWSEIVFISDANTWFHLLPPSGNASCCSSRPEARWEAGGGAAAAEHLSRHQLWHPLYP